MERLHRETIGDAQEPGGRLGRFCLGGEPSGSESAPVNPPRCHVNSIVVGSWPAFLPLKLGQRGGVLEEATRGFSLICFGSRQRTEV
jgi:hypothetical protein